MLNNQIHLTEIRTILYIDLVYLGFGRGVTSSPGGTLLNTLVLSEAFLPIVDKQLLLAFGESSEGTCWCFYKCQLRVRFQNIISLLYNVIEVLRKYLTAEHLKNPKLWEVVSVGRGWHQNIFLFYPLMRMVV